MGNPVRNTRSYLAAIATFSTLIGQASWAQSGDTVTYPPAGPPPSLNFYGLPGLIDLPSADVLPDGQLAVTVSNFAGQTRTSLTFQAFPRITATFRYTGLRDFNSGGFSTFRDRSFDVRYLLAREGRIRPAITVGLQDLAGTGIFSGEYVVATKTFDNLLRLPGRLRVTGGLGWGRLGSQGDIGTPFSGTRDGFSPGDTGGELATGTWFRGPVSPFAGVEWNVNDRLGLKAEYSTDAYEVETGLGIFTRESSLNFGAEYQVNENLRLGGYWLYGSEIGFSAQYQFNPFRPQAPKVLAGPRPIIVRPARTANPSAWTTDWAQNAQSAVTIRDALLPELEEDGLALQGLSVTATQAELRVSNRRYRNESVVVGRAARAMARILPPSVEIFKITPVRNGLPVSTVTIRRSDLERLEFQPDASGLLLANADFDEATPSLENEIRPVDLYPQFSWSVGPFLSPSFFDPDEPARFDAGLAGEFRYRPGAGWLVAGQVRGRIIGNVEDSPVVESLLPRVRTDTALFAAEADLPITQLYVAKQWKTSKNTYARVTAGYLESQFGGVSGEVLWKPQDSKLAIGVEANYARQRDFDQLFGFQDLDVFTGHVSGYYEFGGGFLGQVDVGRYLAGDVGATFTLTREFANGWKVGGFFTLTSASAEEFGEGSFDKGINLTIPIDWFLGRPTTQTVSTTIRPVLRDGGARLSVPNRLFQQVRVGQQSDIVSSWARVWE